MTSIQSLTSDDQNPISIINPKIIHQSDRNNTLKINQPLINNILKTTTWTERLKNYFITTEGRIILADLFFTLICVILQHVMGTCDHSVSDGKTVIKWHVFTPPFGAGPHTAVFFFVLSWTTLAYCIERIWVYLTTGVRVSKKRDLIVHGIIVVLYLTALGFNIWGYILCESTSQVNSSSKAFSPGVCRGDSQAWLNYFIPLIAGVLASCATACTFFVEHIHALTNLLKRRRVSNEPTSTRILP